MSRKLLGLDIRTHSASAVLLETGLKKSAVSGAVHFPFPEDGTFQERLAQALSALTGRLDIKDSVCAMSIASNLFFFRNVSVPFSDSKKIQAMLPYELESELPFPVENLLIDFNKMPGEGSENETRILAAGIETQLLRDIVDTVETWGISPQSIFPVGYAAASRTAPRHHPGETTLFIDLDGENCALYLQISGAISLIRAFPLSRPHVRSAIHLWGHVQRSLAGFESLMETKVSLSAIAINGFEDDKFSKQLETVSSLPVETLRVALPANFDASGDNGAVSSLDTACNGALCNALYLLEGMKGMNFRKGPLAAKNQLSEYRGRLMQTGIIAGIVFLLWLGGNIVGNIMLQRKVENVDTRIRSIFTGTFPNIRTIINPVHQMRTEIETLKKAAYGSTDTTSGIRCIDLLRDMSQNIPSSLDVIFTKLRLSDDGIYIEGTTADFDQVGDIATKLEAIDNVASVSPTFNARDGDRIRFRLRIETRGGDAS